ncbi:MAG: ABC transporter ATP-binding protein [Bacteroidota bacterium]
MKDFLKFLKNLKPYRLNIAFNVLLNILTAGFSVFSLVLIAPFLSILFGIGDTLGVNNFATNNFISKLFDLFTEYIKLNGKSSALVLICVGVVVLFFLKNLFTYLSLYYMIPIRNRVVRDIRNKAYEKIVILPLSYYSEHKKGDILTRTINDIQEIEFSIMRPIQSLVRDPISIIFYLIVLMMISYQLTLFVFVLLPLMGLIISTISKSLRRKSVKARIMQSNLLTMIEESISGLKIIKAFNSIRFAEQKYQEENEAFTKLNIKIYRKADLSSPLSEFLGTIVMIGILLFGGNLVLGSNAGLKPEVFITYLVLFSQIINPAKAISTAFYNIRKGLAAFTRVEELLNAQEVIIEKPYALPIKSFEKEICFHDVSFAYEDEPVLKNIQLSIPKGKTIALVGSSGAGKSTLTDLIPRFYDVISGEITIDGIPIQDVNITDLRELIGLVSQETFLFNDSIYNNITFGKTNIPYEEVVSAAKIANAHEFIEQMPKGYHTQIGDRGAQLSGGQRQRVSIARAILKNPPILILDEATSSLDTESEQIVSQAIANIMINRTSIVIAHRLSTIYHADEIIVLDKGEIIERGTHHELLKLNGTYKKLYELMLQLKTS